jgi:D-psicose/D-tagatose/L-ribulose 3-epimerase
VVPVDRTPLSQRTEIADAADSGASQGMEQFLRDHGTGTVPEHYYDQYVQDSIDRLRQALSAAEGARV